MLSSTALLMAQPSELNLLKVLLYPRALEVIYNWLKEKGYVKPIRFGEALSCYMTLYVCIYCYIFEPQNIGESYVKTVNKYGDIQGDELQVMNSLKHIHDNYLVSRYKNCKVKPMKEEQL
mmetsp:Transcript_48254/g.35436  ORF Transcript_48254/g.35436 Transcript_48254/m.35436 type:complete len:120 (+) Transcript_48254:408-767(+)|eukprot:CAMPEP_0202978504 /NCGR_PEP_ID=MMETSP1396-20130829/84897_1 /ASSEMBLY_ACC=CAM_ASM_000872 /TAXON_ID= /ORGANISM="Pseudokeronopsis sp., Strain Brazil" /LENGTH=119 /DNA_ID=CAMNT_0049717483 /DNA_START=902 /DNA_END=1261 /DNA_ORIENTATION=+